MLSAVVRGRPKDARRSAAKSRAALREWEAPLSASDRKTIAAVLARRAARERLMLTLLLYERLRPLEVADALGVSLKQVGRTYDAMLAEVRRVVARRTRRVVAGRARTSSIGTRLRKAA